MSVSEDTKKWWPKPPFRIFFTRTISYVFNKNGAVFSTDWCTMLERFLFAESNPGNVKNGTKIDDRNLLADMDNNRTTETNSEIKGTINRMEFQEGAENIREQETEHKAKKGVWALLNSRCLSLLLFRREESSGTRLNCECSDNSRYGTPHLHWFITSEQEGDSGSRKYCRRFQDGGPSSGDVCVAKAMKRVRIRGSVDDSSVFEKTVLSREDISLLENFKKGPILKRVPSTPSRVSVRTTPYIMPRSSISDTHSLLIRSLGLTVLLHDKIGRCLVATRSFRKGEVILICSISTFLVRGEDVVQKIKKKADPDCSFVLLEKGKYKGKHTIIIDIVSSPKQDNTSEGENSEDVDTEQGIKKNAFCGNETHDALTSPSKQKNNANTNIHRACRSNRTNTQEQRRTSGIDKVSLMFYNPFFNFKDPISSGDIWYLVNHSDFPNSTLTPLPPRGDFDSGEVVESSHRFWGLSKTEFSLVPPFTDLLDYFIGKGEIRILACRDIKRGDPITWRYPSDYFNENEKICIPKSIEEG